MKNASTKTITLQKALSVAAFKDGFTDFAKRKGWNEKRNPTDQWNYERGRMFAAWLETRGITLDSYPLKAGRWASRTTINHYNAARSEGSIF